MNDRSRPQAAPEVVPTTAVSLLRDPDIIALAAYIGSTSREFGFSEGWDACEREMAQRWKAAAMPVQAVLRVPPHAELQRRRGHLAVVR